MSVAGQAVVRLLRCCVVLRRLLLLLLLLLLFLRPCRQLGRE
jgi:hypothetical protein